MFSFLRKKKIEELLPLVEAYIKTTYKEAENVRYQSNVRIIPEPWPLTPEELEEIKKRKHRAYCLEKVTSPNLSRAEKAYYIRELDKMIDKTFVDSLIERMNEKSLCAKDVYKPAEIDRRLFSHLLSERYYKPAKDTALAIVFALRLSLSEATELLSKAGYSLSHSDKRDVIIEYLLQNSVFDLPTVNEILFDLDQKTIGR